MAPNFLHGKTVDAEDAWIALEEIQLNHHVCGIEMVHGSQQKKTFGWLAGDFIHVPKKNEGLN